jgi:UDP-glucose 4-epimerase
LKFAIEADLNKASPSRYGKMNGHKAEMADDKKCVLVAGGAGYIGSHTAIEMINAGYSVVIIDNLCNSSAECISRLEQITGQLIAFYKVDLLDRPAVEEVFKKHKFSSVMHFAGLKAVGESCTDPLTYYKNNLIGTIVLLEVMKIYGPFNMVFSSSATVYGDPIRLPIDESHPSGSCCTNPYGKTKYFIEEILSDLCKSDRKWNAVLLRYFNPVGSHKSGRIGEDPQGPPNNLMPYIAQVAVGRRPELSVYGNDYDTPDGTGIRDYIHVVDLAIGHVAAVKKLEENCGCRIYNLGTGKGYSVLDMIKAFEEASGKKVAYKIVGRRSGDVATVYADPELAATELGWRAERGLQEMCKDLWNWQIQNPKGFNP